MRWTRSETLTTRKEEEVRDVLVVDLDEGADVLELSFRGEEVRLECHSRRSSRTRDLQPKTDPDVARPPDISEAEAALRPDLLIIESGEVYLPGDVDFGYDIGLPPKTAYACLAETTLLAMEGRFEDYTLGRYIEMDRVKEIFRLFKKHQLEIAGLRSFGHLLTEEDFRRRRELADRLREDPVGLAEVRAAARAGLERIPRTSKGVKEGTSGPAVGWLAAAGVVGLAGFWLGRRRRKRRSRVSRSQSQGA
jgi:hypothetical protein